MKKVKYYYSEATQIRKLPVITNDSGEVLFVFDKKAASVSKLPRVTVASIYDDDVNVLAFGIAVCSPKDLFQKKIGREIAYKRALETPIKQIAGFKRNRVHELSKHYSKLLATEALFKTIGFIPINV